MKTKIRSVFCVPNFFSSSNSPMNEIGSILFMIVYLTEGYTLLVDLVAWKKLFFSYDSFKKAVCSSADEIFI